MKKLVVFAFAILALFASCSKEDPVVSISSSSVNVDLKGTTEPVTLEVNSNSSWTVSTDGQSWYTVSPMEGSGNGTISITVEPQTEAADRSAKIILTSGSATATLSILQAAEVAAVKSGSFVIEEVFFAGFVPEGANASDAGDGDQYIKITNNTDNLLYADGLLICISAENSQNGGYSYYEPTVPLTDSIAVASIYRIPGTGEDVPVYPGHSLVLALAAQNFLAENGAGVDLTKAQFEFFDGEEVEDVDNPDVPNLENWVKISASFTMLHNRGYFSLALAQAPADLTAEDFMEKYPWTGTWDFVMDGEVLFTDDIDAGYYLIANEWVIDGVNLGVKEDIGRLAFNASVDAGYTGCGEIDRDPNRYGKSAIRKKAGEYLADTNNSTNDFTPNSVPSLK